MSARITIPQPFGVNLSGALDLDLDEIRIKELPTLKLEASVKELPTLKLEASVKELPTLKLEASIKELPVIKTDSKVDLGLDNIRIQELPKIQLELSVKPVRVHLPLNYSFCIALFGIPLVKFSVCGEGMVVSEDYHPHASENCR